MSIFYILGSDKPINNGDLFNVQEIDISFLKFDDNIKYLNDKKFYVLNVGYKVLGYNITNFNNFFTDDNKKYFESLLLFIKNQIENGNKISLYQFFESDDYKREENLICSTQILSTNTLDYPDDYFSFEFKTKYIFHIHI